MNKRERFKKWLLELHNNSGCRRAIKGLLCIRLIVLSSIVFTLYTYHLLVVHHSSLFLLH